MLDFEVEEFTELLLLLDLKRRRPSLLHVLDCHLVWALSYFAAEPASYQLPSEAGCQEVWDQDLNLNREIANFPDYP